MVNYVDTPNPVIQQTADKISGQVSRIGKSQKPYSKLTVSQKTTMRDIKKVECFSSTSMTKLYRN